MANRYEILAGETFQKRLSKIEEIGVQSEALTESFDLHVTKPYRTHFYSVFVKREKPEISKGETYPQITADISFDVHWDKEGHFKGLRKQVSTNSGIPYHLEIFVKDRVDHGYLVKYAVDKKDQSKGKVVEMLEQEYDQHDTPTLTTTCMQPAWGPKLTRLDLPETINIPETVHRLVFGKNINEAHPSEWSDLSTMDIDRSPLVPFSPPSRIG